MFKKFVVKRNYPTVGSDKAIQHLIDIVNDLEDKLKLLKYESMEKNFKDGDAVTVRWLEKKYNIMVINASHCSLISQFCKCGHHAREHIGHGTMGACKLCSVVSNSVHNFVPNKEIKRWNM